MLRGLRNGMMRKTVTGLLPPSPTLSARKLRVAASGSGTCDPVQTRPLADNISHSPYKANPAYKGKWYAPMIDNPEYKGEWAPRKIANPDFFEDLTPVKSLNKIVCLEGLDFVTYIAHSA